MSTYTYAVVNRLTQARTKTSGGAVTITFQYACDGAGERINQTVNGSTTSSTYNAANELAAAGGTSYTYDATGNETGNTAGEVQSVPGVHGTLSVPQLGRVYAAASGDPAVIDPQRLSALPS